MNACWLGCPTGSIPLRCGLRPLLNSVSVSLSSPWLLPQCPTLPRLHNASRAVSDVPVLRMQDAVGTLKQEKTLTELIVAAANSYETSPALSRGVAAAPVKGIAALSAPDKEMKLGDKWARVSLARLCAAVVYGDWNSTDKFVRGPGSAYWRLLVLLATR